MKKINYNRGDAQFGLMILGFLVLIFIIWVYTGGPKKEESKKPFITPGNSSTAPLEVYGPNEKPD